MQPIYDRSVLGQVPAVEGPDTLRWDSSLPYTDNPGVIYNRGCPVGYFAQFVGPGEPDAQPLPGAGAQTWIRCRKMATTTPETLVAESGVTWEEATQIYTQAVLDTARQVGGAVAAGVAWLPTLFLVGLGLWLFGGRYARNPARRTGEPITARVETLDDLRQRHPSLASDLRARGFDALVTLVAGWKAAQAYRTPRGRFVYVSGSRRLFERYLREQEER